MKNVAFDLGNVICHVDIDKFLDFLVTNKIFENIQDAGEVLSGIQIAQDIGLYSIRHGFYKFQDDPYHVNELYNFWLNIAQPSLPMIELLKELQSKDFNIALLSNIGFDHANYLRKQIPILQDCINHFSCYIGTRKPSHLFFKTFIKKYNWDKNVLFFDDLQDNINTANNYLTGIRFDLDDFESDEKAAEYVRDLLL